MFERLHVCLLLLAGFLFFPSLLFAQEVWGYVSGMPSLMVLPKGDLQQFEGNTIQGGSNLWWQMLVHHRLNVRWQMTKFVHVDVGMRNRLITGSAAMLSPQSIGYDKGWADLSWNWAVVEQRHPTTTDVGEPAEALNRASFVGNTSFDRLSLTFEKGKWRVQAGRQRINWGQTFVWNPNDIFNTYSFFDFDYPERPGCDAIRNTYFHNATSSSEVAASLNHEGKVTAAMLHRLNRNGYDAQILVGEQAQTDLVVGGALTKDVNGVNIRGEFSYFHPIKQFTDTTGIVAFSAGVDYIFSNSLMLQAEVLYNNVGASGGGLMDIYGVPLSAKRMSVCTWSLFAGATYPISQRLSGSLSSVSFVNIQSVYLGFTLDYSVSTNIDFSLVGQYFSSCSNVLQSATTMQIFLAFARLKYSF